MNKFKLLMLFVLIANIVSAQTRQLSGTVTDSASNGVVAATVKVKGGKAATITDADGKFTLPVPGGNITLQISSVGFAQKEVVVAATDNNVSISLSSSTGALGEVVVTALGVKREKKALTFASQTVGGDELRKAANINFVDALSGKAAGIDIKVSNSGAGGSTKAVLRGNKSLQGLSEALYVIDGIPMVNNKGGQPDTYGGTDGGDGLSAINPADIETITVLRGANAAILYGSQGANGVILITTKKGKTGKVTVDVNQSTVLEQVKDLPDFQYRYGTVGGDYSWTAPDLTQVTPDQLVNISKTPYDNVKSSSYQKGYIKDFFQTGTTVTSGVSVQGGNDKTTVFFSYSNVSATGVMPTNTYGKNNFSFNQSTKLFNDKVTLSSNVLFSSEISKNRPGAGYYNNPLTGLYLFARDRDFNSFKQNYQVFDSTRNLYKMNWYSTEEKQNNPFWELNKDPKLQKSSRVIASVKASWDIVPHLRFEARGNIDYNNVTRDSRYAAGGNSVTVSSTGTWSYSRYVDQALYTDGILTYNNSWGDFSLTALGGVSYQKNHFNDGLSFGNGTVAMLYPNVFTFANMPPTVIFNQTGYSIIKEGAFADAQFGFKNYLFLDVAGRNDWASTLALTGNQSYLYPSVGLSAIVSDVVKLPKAISFLKVRGSISQTANEVPFNVVNPQNSINNAAGGIGRNTQVPFTNLKPEKIVSNEAGLEMRFLNNKLGFDFTYYNDISTNQFLTLSAPSGSGYTFYYVNAGKITNSGVELTLNATPVSTRNFTWTTSLNASHNKNKIVELIASNPDYQVGGDNEGFASIIKAGGSFNDVYIYHFARNDQGQIILDNNAVPTKEATQTKVGNVNPDFLAGWNNNFAYGNWFASVLVNGKFGGVAFSKTQGFLDSYGVSEATAAARDKGYVTINAVMNGKAVTTIDPYTYYSAVGDRNKIMEPYVFSRTNVRLGQLAIGYNIKSKSANPIIRNASISLVGRNLFFFYKKAPFDPEQSVSTANNVQSNDIFGLPPTRSYGINVKLTF